MRPDSEPRGTMQTQYKCKYYCHCYVDPQAAENSPYPPKLYLPPKIRRNKFGLAGYQPNFDEELAAGKIPAKIRLILKNC